MQWQILLDALPRIMTESFWFSLYFEQVLGIMFCFLILDAHVLIKPNNRNDPLPSTGFSCVEEDTLFSETMM